MCVTFSDSQLFILGLLYNEELFTTNQKLKKKLIFFKLSTLFNCILILITALTMTSCKGSHSVNHKLSDYGQMDTIKLLTDNQVKFWDVIRNKENSNNHTGEYLNWMFSWKMQLVEYSYQNQKRIQHVYGGDIIIGYLDFKIKNDTLYITSPLEEKYLIRKINLDTLIVQHVGEFGLKSPILFIKAKNQQEVPKF